jgi:hypothetical protein
MAGRREDLGASASRSSEPAEGLLQTGGRRPEGRGDNTPGLRAVIGGGIRQGMAVKDSSISADRGAFYLPTAAETYQLCHEQKSQKVNWA